MHPDSTKNRSDQVDINDDVTYTVNVVDFFKTEDGVSYGQVLTFITGGNSAACGVNLDIGEEYLLGLDRLSTDPFNPDRDNMLTVGLCDLSQTWASVSDDDKDALEVGCEVEDHCPGLCSEYQVTRRTGRHLGCSLAHAHVLSVGSFVDSRRKGGTSVCFNTCKRHIRFESIYCAPVHPRGR